MVIQNHSELGEGSAMPTDPHHTPTIFQPSSSQPQKTQKPRKPKRKDTHVPQPSGPTESVVDEAVHKELGDRLVKAATTAFSLEVEQDSGNITKTQSRETPNEPSSQGTNSGGGPMCQETMGDTTAQTRDEESLGEDASKQGRKIDAIHADKNITLVNDIDNEMFDMDDLVSTAATTVTITTKEITLAQALEALKTLKPKVKGIVFQEPDLQERAEKEQEANISLIETCDDIQEKIDVDHQLAERLQQKVDDDKEKVELKQLIETIPDEKEVAIDAIPLAVKSPRSIDWKIHKEGKKSYYQIIYMLVEKKYPLTPPTLSMMLEKKLQINYEIARTPQPNNIIKRINQMLVEVARTMLIFSKAPLFLWVEAVATTSYTQNRSLIHTRHNKTPYELIYDRKLDLKYLHVFGALCYPINDNEDLGKIKPKADIGIFIGCSPVKKAYRIYNKQTRLIMETIHVDFDGLTEMASKQFGSGPVSVNFKILDRSSLVSLRIAPLFQQHERNQIAATKKPAGRRKPAGTPKIAGSWNSSIGSSQQHK
nr:retrovirus-related Pol polyprotein from transposon TNT 1-94 [Tanacetum cinerariifolium]